MMSFSGAGGPGGSTKGFHYVPMGAGNAIPSTINVQDLGPSMKSQLNTLASRTPEAFSATSSVLRQDETLHQATNSIIGAYNFGPDGIPDSPGAISRGTRELAEEIMPEIKPVEPKRKASLGALGRRPK